MSRKSFYIDIKVARPVITHRRMMRELHLKGQLLMVISSEVMIRKRQRHRPKVFFTAAVPVDRFVGHMRLGDKMIERIKDLYHQYPDRIMQWYDGLEILYQYGVLFLLIVIGLLLVSFVILSRITK